MDIDFLLETAKQVPQLVVLGYIVHLFLGHLNRRDKARDIALREIGDRCHLHQDRMAKATNACVAKATESLDQNTEMLGELAKVVERANGERK